MPMQMLSQILIHTPTAVWALLAGLIAWGVMQSRTRTINHAQALAMPAVLLSLSLWSLAPALLAAPLLAVVWLKSLVLGFVAGRRTPQLGNFWRPELQRFVVAGSWIPMGFILFIFSLRYGSAVATALHPQWRTALALQLPLAIVFGLLSGLSLGRTFQLLRMARLANMANIAQTAPATMPAHAATYRA